MKASITILLLLFVWFSSTAQVSLGGRIGSNFTNFAKLESNSYDYNWGEGIYSGLVFNYLMTPELQLQLELNFSSEKSRKKEIFLLPNEILNIPEASTGQPMYAFVSDDYASIPRSSTSCKIYMVRKGVLVSGALSDVKSTK